MHSSKMPHLSPLNTVLGLVLLAAVTACEPSTSSSTHWLTCGQLSDCGTSSAVECKAGYCVDVRGERISSGAVDTAGKGGASASVAASVGRGGGSTAASVTANGGSNASTTSSVLGSGGAGVGQGQGGAAGGGGAISSGGTRQVTAAGASGTSSANGGSGLATAAGGTVGGSGGASASHSGGAVAIAGASTRVTGIAGNAGTGSFGGSAGRGGTSALAGGSSAGAAGVCSITPDFLAPLKDCVEDSDCEKVRYMVNCCGTSAWIAVSSAKRTELEACLATQPEYPLCPCPSTNPTVEDGRYVSNEGTDVVARCVNHQCQTRVASRSCGPTNPEACSVDQICTAYETVVGPSTNIDYACVPNPCTDKLSCTCAQSVCSLRSDVTRTCNQPTGAGVTSFTDIQCQDGRQ